MEIASLYQLFREHPHVSTDTRTLVKGDLFFALKGESFDGNAYTRKALDEGASYAIIDDEAYYYNDRCIVVENVLKTLQELALYHRKQFSIPFLAITGSNGKTTTKELITQVLSRKFKTHATKGNLNNHIGVPLTLLQMPSDVEIAIIEMGANHQQEIASYCLIAQPTHGLITNCGKAHIEGFGGEEGVRKGKGELYDYLREQQGTIFRNADLDYLNSMAEGIASQITYGMANAQYLGRPLTTDIFLRVALLNSGAETEIRSQLVGSYNFYNILAAVAVGLHFGVPVDDIRSAIESYQPGNSRSQLIRLGTNQVIMDAYNANPTSMQAAIKNFAEMPLTNKMLWIGAMKEMGEYQELEHRNLIQFIKNFEWQDIILVGKEFEQLREGIRWFASSADAAEYVLHHLPKEATILIKGSRGSRMEVLADVLKTAVRDN